MMHTAKIALAVATATALLSGPATAGNYSLEVSPVTLELQVEPGRAHTASIVIKNTGEQPEHIRVYCQDWTLKPDGVVVFVPAGRLPQSASAWVQPAPSEFDLKAGESRQVRYTIRVPEEAVGETRTVVIFEANPREIRAPGGPSQLVPRIGTIMYLQCGPPPEPRARIVEFAVNHEGGVLAVENATAAHLRFTGHLEVRRDGRLIRRRDLNAFVVLPAPFHLHRTEIPPEALAELPVGRYEVTAILDPGGTALLGGRTALDVTPPPVEGPIVIAEEK
jgi:P pilus assembly chaperone PapD